MAQEPCRRRSRTTARSSTSGRTESGRRPTTSAARPCGQSARCGPAQASWPNRRTVANLQPDQRSPEQDIMLSFDDDFVPPRRAPPRTPPRTPETIRAQAAASAAIAVARARARPRRRKAGDARQLPPRAPRGQARHQRRSRRQPARARSSTSGRGTSTLPAAPITGCRKRSTCSATSSCGRTPTA